MPAATDNTIGWFRVSNGWREASTSAASCGFTARTIARRLNRRHVVGRGSITEVASQGRRAQPLRSRPQRSVPDECPGAKDRRSTPVPCCHRLEMQLHDCPFS